MTTWQVTALLLFTFRYLRLVVNLYSHWTYRPIPLPARPQYKSEDVTVIIPTVDGDGDELRRTVRSCLSSHPQELILVTTDSKRSRALQLVKAVNSDRIRICTVERPNKRRQLCAAIPLVSTDITVLADDDVIWPHSLFHWLLAPFENAKVGGVGTSQRLFRSGKLSLWGFLGAIYLERRNFDCSACLNMDGGLPCLSGRTVAYRSIILKDAAFLHGLANETWRGNVLNADDDNFMTRWTYRHGWQIKMQYHKACEVQTTLEEGPKFLRQCLRWARSNWRSNISSMILERHCWWTQPWTTYAVLQTTFTAWAFTDLIIMYAIVKACEPMPDQMRTKLVIAAALWIFVFAKTIKLVGNFVRYPTDIFLLPVAIAFGHVHGVIKLIGLLTLSAATWGSRSDADGNSHAQAEMTDKAVGFGDEMPVPNGES